MRWEFLNVSDAGRRCVHLWIGYIWSAGPWSFVQWDIAENGYGIDGYDLHANLLWSTAFADLRADAWTHLRLWPRVFGPIGQSKYKEFQHSTSCAGTMGKSCWKRRCTEWNFHFISYCILFIQVSPAGNALLNISPSELPKQVKQIYSGGNHSFAHTVTSDPGTQVASNDFRIYEYVEWWLTEMWDRDLIIFMFILQRKNTNRLVVCAAGLRMRQHQRTRNRRPRFYVQYRTHF